MYAGSNVSASGTISLSNFHGQSNTSPAVTVYNYTMTCGSSASQTQHGFDTASAGGGSNENFGSLSNNPQSGSTFANGFNPTIISWKTMLVSNKAGFSTRCVLEIGGGTTGGNTGFTSITATSAVVNGGATTTLARSAAIYFTDAPANSRGWRWNNSTFGFKTALTGASGTVKINA